MGKQRYRVMLLPCSLAIYSISQVEEILPHHNYTHRGNFEYDIAMIKLKHPVRLTDSVGLVCLPPPNGDPPTGNSGASLRYFRASLQ